MISPLILQTVGDLISVQHWDNTDIEDTVYRSAAFQDLINKAWFNDENDLGPTYRGLFSTDDGALRNEVLALAASGVRNAMYS